MMNRVALLFRAGRALLLAALTVVCGCGEQLAGPHGRDPVGASLTPPPSVPDQLIAEVAPTWTVPQINTTFGTTTLALIPGSDFALLQIPPGETFETLSAALATAGACTTCEPNYYVATPESQQGSIAIYEGSLTSSDLADQGAMTRVRPPRGRGTKGGGMTVAVLDTGIDATHPELASRVRSDGYDFAAMDADPDDEADGINQDLDAVTDEGAGHGTHVAGIVHHIAPNALLLPVRVLDSEGNGTIFSLAQGVDYATAAGANVINMSLALNGHSTVAQVMIQNAFAAGIVLVSSVGNEGVQTSTHFPANLPEVMGVAAVDAAELKTAFSNYGSVVSLSAPGEGIISTYLFQGYATWSGTSMAAPFVAGTAAVAMRLNRELPPAAIQTLIQTSAEPMDHTGMSYEGLMGTGRVDVLRTVLPDDPGDG